MNLTITVPKGSTNHGNPSLICTPPGPSDYIIFYFSNYFAHAATVIATPGQGNRETFLAILLALLIPGSGVSRAVDAIRRHSIFERDAVRRAIRAGALCMIVREASYQEQTIPDDNVEYGVASEHVQGTENTELDNAGAPQELESRDNQQKRPWWDPLNPKYLPDDTVVYGQSKPPRGFKFALVPPDIKDKIESIHDGDLFMSSYNAPKILISFVQAIWAIMTIYKARGNQIDQYGYAAFGLTVAPYTFISLMNIVGSLLNPEYPAIRESLVVKIV
ncbi:hypothetical protein BDV28DRAFT_151346 [Aspergillus coremiiformis]|uniref:Uncharacterized protein n=1 Tax=Aspergillus coremiiformis TaxID=138285 RepID=A0A5N6YZ74_9EURO|nr:hypothetical protein BDV28DRAFT_151346 [Aspergillus coremiiformis]